MHSKTTAVALLVGWTFVLAALFAPIGGALAENATLSGCQICANTGDCSRAYRGEAGQFCGNWLDRSNTRQPCCCPTNAVCKVSNYACNCAFANTGRGPYDGGGYYDGGYSFVWLWWLLGSLLLVFCCGSCCYAMFRRRNEVESPVAYPVAEPVPPMYGSAAPMYGAPSATPTAPMYTAQPAYGVSGYGGGGYAGGGAPYAGRSGMGAGTGAVLGGGAGLLGGLLLGEAIADAGRGGGYDGGGGGYDGGGGGYDGGGGGGGDFAGDF